MNDFDSRKRDMRVSLQDSDIKSLMEEFPKLSRTEITDVIARTGTVRSEVEAELARVSNMKS